MKSVKDVDASTNSRKLRSFAFMLSKVSKHADDSESSENPPDQFQRHFVFSHLLIILDINLEADHWLSCLSQMSMIVKFVPSINKSLYGKRLTNA